MSESLDLLSTYCPGSLGLGLVLMVQGCAGRDAFPVPNNGQGWLPGGRAQGVMAAVMGGGYEPQPRGYPERGLGTVIRADQGGV